MQEGDHQPAKNEHASVPETPPQGTAGGAPPAGAPPKAAGQAAHRPRRLIVTLAVAVLAVAAAVVLRLFVYESDIVEGSSMLPGLRSGDYVLICKLGCDDSPPQRFEIVTFRDPTANDVVIKRVIGLPNEWVWIWGNHVFINGGRLQEPYLAQWRGAFGAPVWVPPNHIFVLGDNRDYSEDSRTWGPVPLSSVRGRAAAVYFPFGRARILRR